LVAIIACGHVGYEDAYVSHDGEVADGLLDACDFYGINHKKFNWLC